jgi:hypothetical protein
MLQIRVIEGFLTARLLTHFLPQCESEAAGPHVGSAEFRRESSVSPTTPRGEDLTIFASLFLHLPY